MLLHIFHLFIPLKFIPLVSYTFLTLCCLVSYTFLTLCFLYFFFFLLFIFLLLSAFYISSCTTKHHILLLSYTTRFLHLFDIHAFYISSSFLYHEAPHIFVLSSASFRLFFLTLFFLTLFIPNVFMLRLFFLTSLVLFFLAS